MPNMERYLKAQNGTYEEALAEIRAGRKRSHWMWFIFPQIAGLGVTGTAQYYAIRDLDEAKEYLSNPVLKSRLLEISQALLEIPENDALSVLGYPDNLKLRSCMTLFREADPSLEVFGKVLDKFYGGEPDRRTLQILGVSAG